MRDRPEAFDADVLIVGYGPVGAALAGLLGHYGVRTLVIDKAPGIFAAPRAIALDNEALRILQMVGLDERDFARVPIPQVVFRSPRVGDFARIDCNRTVDGHPMLVTFHQPDLERALRRNVALCPTVQARTGVELLDFEDGSEGVRATVRTAEGGRERLFVRYLVGADGANSPVREAIGEAFHGQTYAEDWLIVDAIGVPNNIDHVEFLCDPQRPSPHMVAPGGRTRWEFMLRPGETHAEMEKDSTIAELLRPWANPGEYRIERKAVYRFHARTCARFSRGRVFLAGDAAHITPPFVGQGLVSGLRDAANLAWKLTWVVQGRTAASILDTYDQERRPHAAKMIALARFAGLLIMPRSRPRALLTHGAIKWLQRVPLAASFVSGNGLKPLNVFGRGLFARGRSRVGRGTWLSQGTLRDGSGVILRSDDLLGRGLTLLCTGVAVPPALGDETAREWAAVNGTTLVLCARGIAARGSAVEDLDGTFADLTSRKWCVVLRPDRTVLHDGPLDDVERILRESIEILRGGGPKGAAAGRRPRAPALLVRLVEKQLNMTNEGGPR